jgi:Fur family ferric uptake transcriptional regulator
MMTEEHKIFGEYIRSEGLKETSQRQQILDAFLSVRDHVSAEDIYRTVNRRDRKVGFTTVYRTMKLISDCGLAREVMFNDGVARFEHTYGREHHHHLICTRCKKVIEFSSRTMDDAERGILRKHGFELQSHKYEIFGLCRECREHGEDGT